VSYIELGDSDCLIRIATSIKHSFPLRWDTPVNHWERRIFPDAGSIPAISTPLPFLNFISIQKRYRINQYIRISPIRVIDEDGKNLGVLETTEALKIAHERGLDLIEISATARPPVCKIMGFGKFKYDREKGEREHGKKQKEVEVKAVRIGFTTGAHDLKRTAEQAKGFLEKGDKVRVEMRLRGREKAHGDLALKKFNAFLEIIQTEFGIESPPKKFPRGFQTIIFKTHASR